MKTTIEQHQQAIRSALECTEAKMAVLLIFEAKQHASCQAGAIRNRFSNRMECDNALLVGDSICHSLMNVIADIEPAIFMPPVGTTSPLATIVQLRRAIQAAVMDASVELRHADGTAAVIGMGRKAFDGLVAALEEG